MSIQRTGALVAAVVLTLLAPAGCKSASDDESGESSAAEETGRTGDQTPAADRTPAVVPTLKLDAAAELLAVDLAALESTPEGNGNFATLTVTGEDGAEQRLGIERLDVRVEIEGRLARTTVEQVFRNEHGRQMEGTYAFTLPEGAAISRLAMDVEGVMTEGELVERERAREIYESIVRRRKDPALLEWQGGNRFQTQVFPIPAKGTKTVILAYEVVLPEDRDGLRYVYDLPRLTTENESEAIGTFTFELQTDTQAEVDVDGYAATVEDVPGGKTIEAGFQGFVAKGPLSVRLGKSTLAGDERPAHIALATHQRLASSTTQGQRPAPEHFFAIDLVPHVPAVSDGATRNLVVAIDTSAGVGEPVLDQVRLAALIGLSSLPDDAEWAVVHGDYRVARCEPKTESATHAGAAGCLAGLSAGGATDLEALLNAAVAAANEMNGPTAIVLFSDGAASLGQLDGDVIAGVAESAVAARADLSLHTVAVGHAPSEDSLDKLARTGAGHSLRMTPVDRPDAFAARLAERVQEPVLTSVSVAVTSGDVDALWPARPRYMERGEALLVLGRLESQKATVKVTGRWNGSPWESTFELERPAPGKTVGQTHDGRLFSNFWARAAIGDMHERGEDTASVVSFSLDYGVMSPYTSFLVLENQEAYERFEVERRKEAERVAATQREVEADEAQDGTEHGLAAQKNLEKSDEDLSRVLAETETAIEGEKAEERDKVGEMMDPSALDQESLKGSSGGEAFGTGGLGTTGTGVGGGGTDEGSFGIGRLGNKGGGYGSSGARVNDKNHASPKFRAGNAEVRGSLDKAIIRRVVRRHRNELKFCYQKVLVGKPSLEGKAVVQWTIDASGNVAAATLASNELGDVVGNCLVRSVRRWRFPAPKGGGLVIVKYPFVFDNGVDAGPEPAARLAEIEAMDESALTVDDSAEWITLLLVLDRKEDAAAQLKAFSQRHAQTPLAVRYLALDQNIFIAGAFPDEVLTLAREVLATRAERATGAERAAASMVAVQLGAAEDNTELLTALGGDVPLPDDAAQSALRVVAEASVSNARELLAAWRKVHGADFAARTSASIQPLRTEFLDALLTALEGGERPVTTGWSSQLSVLTGAVAAGELQESERVVSLVVEACAAPGSTWTDCRQLVQSLPQDRVEATLSAVAKARLAAMDEIRGQDMANPELIREFADMLRTQGRRAEADRLLSEIVEFAAHDYGARLAYIDALREVGSELEVCREYGVAVQLDPRQRDHFRDMMRLRRANEKADTDALRECIVQGVSNLPVNRAISLVLTWDDPEADIDLHVDEVGGHEVWYQAKESPNGGLLYYDITDGFGPEIYVLGSGPKGTYALSLVYYAKGPGKVSGTLTVLRSAGSRSETRQEIPFTLTGPESKTKVPVGTLDL